MCGRPSSLLLGLADRGHRPGHALGPCSGLDRSCHRMAGFVIVAVVMRPVGGWSSDRLGPIPVLTVVYAVLTVGAAVQSFTPALMPLGTIAFLTMAAALGAGSGATFALVAQNAPASKVGSVTGLVGAAGGLGGFVPPLVMGFLHGRLGSYGVGLVLLAAVAASTMVLTMTVVRSAALRRIADASKPLEPAPRPASGIA